MVLAQAALYQTKFSPLWCLAVIRGSKASSLKIKRIFHPNSSTSVPAFLGKKRVLSSSGELWSSRRRMPVKLPGFSLYNRPQHCETAHTTRRANSRHWSSYVIITVSVAFNHPTNGLPSLVSAEYSHQASKRVVRFQRAASNIPSPLNSLLS